MKKLPVKINGAGLALPVLGLGTWGMGGRAVRDPLNDDARDIALIKTGLTLGLTHIDTAEYYAEGHAEKLVAQAIADTPRASLFLASKVFGTNLAPHDVIKACEGSLRRLGIDFLDLYYIHHRNEAVPLKETARAFNALVRDGRIKQVGVCNFKPTSMQEFQAYLDVPLAVNQSHYNLVVREVEQAGLLSHCQKAGALFLAWRPLLWCQKDRPNQPSGNAWDRGLYPLLDSVADSYGKTNVQVALNWLINQENVCTLVKTSHADHLREIMACLDWTLAPHDIERLRTQFPEQQRLSPSVPLG